MERNRSLKNFDHIVKWRNIKIKYLYNQTTDLILNYQSVGIGVLKVSSSGSWQEIYSDGGIRLASLTLNTFIFPRYKVERFFFVQPKCRVWIEIKINLPVWIYILIFSKENLFLMIKCSKKAIRTTGRLCYYFLFNLDYSGLRVEKII